MTITGTVADINEAYASNGITGLGNEAVTIIDTTLGASILNALDGNTEGIINAASVNTLTGPASAINAAYASNGITGLGNEAININDTTLMASILNALDSNTEGIVNAEVNTLTGTQVKLMQLMNQMELQV